MSIQDQIEKQLAHEKEQYRAKSEANAALGVSYRANDLQPCHTPLIERVQMDIDKAESRAHKLSRLMELRELLARNPDVVRILDLMKEVID